MWSCRCDISAVSCILFLHFATITFIILRSLAWHYCFNLLPGGSLLIGGCFCFQGAASIGYAFDAHICANAIQGRHFTAHVTFNSQTLTIAGLSLLVCFCQCRFQSISSFKLFGHKLVRIHVCLHFGSNSCSSDIADKI